MYVFLIFPEVFGYKEFLGRVTSPVPSLQNHSSHSSSHSSSHRMLLGSSSSSGSNGGPEVVWKTCREFAKAGAEEYGRTTFEAYNIEFSIIRATWAKTLFALRIPATEIIVSLVMFSLPLMLVEWFIPLFLAPTRVRRMYYWRARLMIATLIARIITITKIVTAMVTTKATSVWTCSSVTITMT